MGGAYIIVVKYHVYQKCIFLSLIPPFALLVTEDIFWGGGHGKNTISMIAAEYVIRGSDELIGGVWGYPCIQQYIIQTLLLGHGALVTPLSQEKTCNWVFYCCVYYSS